jgi:hypothetical protein
MDGYALLGWGDLTQAQYAAGVSASTSDIPRMSRPDAAWSMAVIYVIASLMKKMLESSTAYRTVDIYHDPKGLTASHVRAWQDTIRHLLTREGLRYCRERGINLGDPIRVRRIEAVKKPKAGEAMDKFQLGVSLSHRLCSHATKLIQRKSRGRILVENMSDLLAATIEQWDGKPFPV